FAARQFSAGTFALRRDSADGTLKKGSENSDRNTGKEGSAAPSDRVGGQRDARRQRGGAGLRPRCAAAARQPAGGPNNRAQRREGARLRLRSRNLEALLADLSNRCIQTMPLAARCLLRDRPRGIGR